MSNMKLRAAGSCGSACALLVAATLSGCSGGPDIPQPADPNSESVSVHMLFDHGLFNSVGDRDNPCHWFDGVQNRAALVIISINTIQMNGAGNPVTVPVYADQVFKNGVDFSGGNPNGIQFNIPKNGFFSMDVTVIGEPNDDCCPGDPPGRPVFKARWGYVNHGGFSLYANLPEFKYCLFL